MQTINLRAVYFVHMNRGRGGVEEQTLDRETKVSDQTTKIFKLLKKRNRRLSQTVHKVVTIPPLKISSHLQRHPLHESFLAFQSVLLLIWSTNMFRAWYPDVAFELSTVERKLKGNVDAGEDFLYGFGEID